MMHEAIPDRGYVPLYQGGSICPGCHGKHWNIGRLVAECASCGTALPFAAGELERAMSPRLGREDGSDA